MSANRIYKFDLEPHENAIPGIARVLGVGWQGEADSAVLRLWAEVDPADPVLEWFWVALTGEEPPPDFQKFIGTAIGPRFVGHVYQLSPGPSR